jgi:hypothetical protein
MRMHGGGFFIEADTKSWLGLIQAQKPGSKAFGLTASNPSIHAVGMDTSSYGISDALPAKAWAPCLSPTGGGLLVVILWRCSQLKIIPDLGGRSTAAPLHFP